MPALLLRSLESSTHEEIQSKDFKSGTSGYGGDLRLYLGEAGFADNGYETVRANCISNRVPECFSGTISDHGYYSKTVKRCPAGDC